MRRSPSEGERALLWVAMRGVCGTMKLVGHFLQGDTVVMVDTYPSGPRLWAELFERHRLESVLLFGAAMHQMIQEFPDRTFPSIKSVGYGGSCFAPSLVQRSMEQFPNAEFMQGYSMTENMGSMARLGPQDHKRRGEASEEELARMGSAGQVVRRETFFVEDLDRPGSGLPPPQDKGGIGQICTTSEMIMMGYFGAPEKTREVMPDGKWYRTGDVGRIDEDGYLYIVGRVKDIIPAYRGFNIAPRDIEEVLYRHPGVAQAVVVGLPHPSGAGEAIAAFAVPRDDFTLSSQELRQLLRDVGTPSWQEPDAIYVVERLPTTNGKVARRDIQAPAFLQALLARELVSAACRAEGQREAAESVQVRLPDLIADRETWHLKDLKRLFGVSALAAMEALCPQGSASACLADWRRVLEPLSPEELSSFALAAGSLLMTRG